MCNPPNPARVARQNIVCTLAPVRRPSTCNTCFLRSQLLRSQLLRRPACRSTESGEGACTRAERIEWVLTAGARR
eukprot:scaffold1726_cov56-Phaeocystis_antarctica.AAC.1